MATEKAYRLRAVVGAPRPDLALIAFTERVETKLAASIQNPGTVITDLTTARTNFAAAVAIKSTQRDTAGNCAAMRQKVIDALHHAKDLVNGAAEKAPPEQAKAIIEGAGFRTKKVSVKVTVPFLARYGGVMGAVLLKALSVGRNAMYYFQFSTDQKSWSSCPNIMKSKTLVTGLTVGTTYYFRFQAQTRKGLGDWSDVVSFVVR